MNAKRQKHVSKFLSLVLRHQPGLIGITLDEAGWTPVAELIARAEQQGMGFSADELFEVVAESDKSRFALSEDRQRIRANQGHSVAVDLGLEATIPPDVLYHGTVARFLTDILRQGLVKGKRHHVHLSVDEPTAQKVGQRRGIPIILEIDSGRMNEAGFLFYCSANGVWLTDHVPPLYVTLPKSS